jgi:hypothetical protein
VDSVRNANLPVKRAAWAAAVLMLVAAGAAQAQELYVTGGTLGGGVGAAYNFGPHVGVHAEIEGMAFSHNVDVDDNQYDGHLSLKQGGFYLDLFPFASSAFRVTAGALFNGDTLTAHAVPNADGDYKIGNDYVPAVGGSPTATATLPHVMPYLGIGYGHKSPTKGFGFSFDAGVAYGRPNVSYAVPDVYNEFVTQQDILQEEQDISNKVGRYRWYPVVQVAVTYRF